MRTVFFKKIQIKYKICRINYIFLKIRKFEKKVLTFAFGGVIITKLSARADANEFF